LERNFPSFKLTFNLYRMVLNKGEEKIPEKLERRFSPEILESSPASKEKIAAFLRKVDPIFWGEYSAADITMDDNHLYLAILDKNREFISLAGLWIDEQIGIISIIGTDPDFRNQGYATSIVASSVQFLFKHTNIILIHVRTDNPSAVHVYQKVGYKAKYEYIVIKMR
ncbi:MAG: GNAT family N-acetyltransferase, partial [Promethearchaeota archaeon]